LRSRLAIHGPRERADESIDVGVDVNFDGDGDGDDLCATGTTKHTWTIWNAAAPHE
jgi:hypothetical protein